MLFILSAVQIFSTLDIAALHYMQPTALGYM